MSALTKLGISLTAVFVVSLAALAAQIAWVLWRRNRFLRNNTGRGDLLGGDREGDASGGGFREPVKVTKELLYFFRWKDSQSSSRVEPDGRAPTTEGMVSGDVGDEVLKWHSMYRESRMLYTIKEEEKEGEAAAAESDQDGNGSIKEGSGPETAVVVVKTKEESAAELTPFSTPCGSPDRYFTPSPSPPRAERDGAYADYAKMSALC